MMKIFSMTRRLIAIAALAASAAFAQTAQQPANYVGIHGGVNNLHEWDGTVSFGAGVSLPGQVSLKRGTHWGLFGGRQGEHSRWEAEVQGGSFDVKSIALGPLSQPTTASGHYEALTLNAYRVEAIDDAKRFDIYGALGIGWGRVSLPQMGFASTGCDCFPASSKSGLAWLARAGAEYNFDENNKAFVQYTLLGLPRPGSGTDPGVQYQRKTIGAATIGYRRAF
jgi:opacity protein-like surface antigen